MSKAGFAAIFVLGVLVGLVAPRIVGSLSGGSAQTADKWIDTEEKTLKRMSIFEDRLDKLVHTRPESVEELSKQMEAQQGIEDILTKYREAKYAKFAPYIGSGATILAAVMGRW